MTPEEDAAFEQRITDNVREHGCHINFVFDPEHGQPSFAYSVGFPKTVRQPEVIVFGLHMDMMKFMINETLRQCRDGLCLIDWAEVQGLLDGHRCTVRSIPAANIDIDHFNSAIWYYEQDVNEPLTEAVQLVWPSVGTHLYPWHDECPASVREAQPALYRTRLHS